MILSEFVRVQLIVQQVSLIRLNQKYNLENGFENKVKIKEEIIAYHVTALPNFPRSNTHTK